MCVFVFGCMFLFVCCICLINMCIQYSNAIISELDDCPKLIRNVSCCQQVISAHNTPPLNNGLEAEEWFFIFCLSIVHWTLFNLICKWLSENLLLQSACYFVPKEVKSRTDTNQIPWRSQWMGGAIISYLAAWPTGQIVSRFFCSHSPLEIGQRGGRGPYQRSEGAFRRVNWTVIIFVVDIETEALHIFRLICNEDEKLNYVCRPGKPVLPILEDFLEKLRPTMATTKNLQQNLHMFTIFSANIAIYHNLCFFWSYCLSLSFVHWLLLVHFNGTSKRFTISDILWSIYGSSVLSACLNSGATQRRHSPI